MGLTDSNSRQNAEDQYIQYERERMINMKRIF